MNNKIMEESGFVSIRIKAYLQQQGYKINVLCTLLNMHPKDVSNMLNGKKRLSLKEYVMICDFLKVDYSEFLKG